MAAEDVSPDSSVVEPYIPASTSLPEITVKALILGFLLSALLAGANAYLGLKVGLTVSASIPAAVISMAVLRMFREHNILENNIVQTIASAGESLAAGIIFTMPALVLTAWGLASVGRDFEILTGYGWNTLFIGVAFLIGWALGR